MNDLEIKYTISQRIKLIATISASYLFIVSVVMGVKQALNSNFSFLFYVGIVGIVLSVLLFLIVTIWQSPTIIYINNESLDINLPNQKIDGSILWSEVTQLGVGIGHITIDGINDNYIIDFGNIKYNDLKRIKTKLIEVCEARNIPFSNI